MTRTILAIVLVSACASVGCKLDASLKHRCEVDADCDNGRVCVSFTCQPASSGDASASGTNVMFITSRSFPTHFQPLDVADGLCAGAAADAGLPGTYRAWLSTATVYARDRLQGARGWVRTDGVPFVDTIDDLTSGNLLTAPWLDEHGNVVNGDTEMVATGTTSFGYNQPGSTCNEWANDVAANVLVGIPSGTSVFWTQYASVSCGPPMHLYCFGIDYSSPLPARSTTGKIAFLSDGAFFAERGYQPADDQCAAEATAASIPGNFLALVATTNFAAAARFTDLADQTWVRLDGVPLKPPGIALLDDDGPLLAPLNLTSKRRYLGSYNAVTGADAPWSVPDHTTNCENWTALGGSALGSPGPRVDQWFQGVTTSCDGEPSHLYCLQH